MHTFSEDDLQLVIDAAREEAHTREAMDNDECRAEAGNIHDAIDRCEEAILELADIHRLKAWYVTHWHKYGDDSMVILCERMPTIEEAVKFLELNYEPDSSENITISGMGDWGSLVMWGNDEMRDRSVSGTSQANQPIKPQ